jgi:hypothetical protein
MTARVGVLLLRTVLVVLAALASVIAPASADPNGTGDVNAKGDVSAQRITARPGGPPQTATLKFVAGGNQKNGQGQFTFTEPGIGYSVTANVACYYQEKVGPKARRAVFSGPVIAENPNQGTNGFVVAVADNNDSPSGPFPDSPPGPKDFFETAPFDPTSHNCAQDFPPDRFDNDRVLADAWYVTSGNIVIG